MLLRLRRLYASLPPSRDWRSAGHPPPRPILDLSEDNEVVNGARPNTPPLHLRTPPTDSTPHEHASHRQSLKKIFPNGWSPPRKLSRQAMDGLRQLHQFDPHTFTTPLLADKFRVSPEAVRRILKSKWEPTREQKARYAQRERHSRGAFIVKSRMEERIRALDLLKRERQQQHGDHTDKTRPKQARVRGIDAKDTFTFQ